MSSRRHFKNGNVHFTSTPQHLLSKKRSFLMVIIIGSDVHGRSTGANSWNLF